MSMTRKITIDGKEVPFRASAAVPRIYRIKFHRDIYKDWYKAVYMPTAADEGGGEQDNGEETV